MHKYDKKVSNYRNFEYYIKFVRLFWEMQMPKHHNKAFFFVYKKQFCFLIKYE